MAISLTSDTWHKSQAIGTEKSFQKML